jgi:uncharacterized protein
LKSRNSRRGLSKTEAFTLLEKEGCLPRLKKHVLAVSDYAVEIAAKIKANGIDVDLDFIETAAILHDIGRCKTHGIMHGIEGCKILSPYPDYARVCERHIGAGIDHTEAVALGLPEKDYLPETLEEKIIAHADNLISGDKRVSINETIAHFEEKLGRGHPAVKRIQELNDYIVGLMEDAKK